MPSTAIAAAGKMATGIAGPAANVANSVAANNHMLINKVVGILKAAAKRSDGTLKMGWKDKAAIRAVLKNVSNPNRRSILVRAVGNAIAQNILATGTSVSGIVSSIVAPIESRKVTEAQEARRAQELVAASNERIATKAIEAGLWNSGITGLTTQTAGASGQTGSSSGEATTGSFLGG